MDMIRRISIAGAVVVALASAGAARAQDAEKGKQVYAAANPKCKTCHSVAGVGNAKGNLDDVGSKLSADDIKAWLRTPHEMATKANAARKPVMPAYSKDKLSDPDLDALVAYLSSLKKK
jgi:mono/diheme cytochrome c family protein